MIRFVDLRGQETGARFAFFDTVSDTFVGFGDAETWNTIVEFRSDAEGYECEELVERCAGLAPDWTRTPEPRNGEDTRCMICELLDADHIGECKTRDQLVTWLAGEP